VAPEVPEIRQYQSWYRNGRDNVGVTVRPAFRDALRPAATVLFSVLADEPPGRLARALEAFGQQLLGRNAGDPELRGPKFVSGPIPLPGGQLMMVDLGDTPPQQLRELPDQLGGQLSAAGVTQATVDIPPRMGNRYRVIDAFAPAARAFLAPPVRRPYRDWNAPPVELLDAALTWLRSQPGSAQAEPVGLIVSAETPLTWQAAAELGAAVLRSGPTASVTLVSDFVTTAAAAVVTSGFLDATPRAALTAAGAGSTPGEVADRMRDQREMIRSYPEPLGWAAVTVDRDAGRMRFCDWEERPQDRPQGAAPRRFTEQVSDLLVPDAMWYQVLSAGHLERLGEPPPEAVPLREASYELTIGEPEQWLPGHPDRSALLDRGRALLAGCLTTQQRATELIRGRMSDWRAAGWL
jgi:hypothetical protein